MKEERQGVRQHLFSFIYPLLSHLSQQWFDYVAVYISESVAPTLAFEH